MWGQGLGRPALFGVFGKVDLGVSGRAQLTPKEALWTWPVWIRGWRPQKARDELGDSHRGSLRFPAGQLRSVTEPL